MLITKDAALNSHEFTLDGILCRQHWPYTYFNLYTMWKMFSQADFRDSAFILT